MYQASLRGCWAKIDRAKYHREGLQAYIRATFDEKRNRATLRADLDPETGYHVISVQSVPDLTDFQEAAGVMVGDIVHNLRSALDHLAFQLACLHTDGAPRWPRRIQFPIEDESINFPRRCEEGCGGQIFEIHPTHRAIVERHQPYRGLDGRGDSWSGPYVHQLAWLRDLSDADKHRVIPTVLLIPNKFEMFVRESIPVRFEELASWMEETRRGLNPEMELGAQVRRAQLVGENIERHMDTVGYATPQVALDERRPAVPTDDRIVAYVVDVIEEFEQLA